ncbi:E3 ubiquitin-protein ligase rnf213-alpha-like, partial [Mercenaria mercenaria]|uniref:E3 ubiquitin-protein ligase rnf213-alpha-like n=1 Tax=Mercenaria mercenaria TaxID=6596 RepID=UPI00234F56D4
NKDRKQSNTYVWHQFDCFMEHEPRSLKDKFFDYFLWKKDLIKHAEKAAHAFCPDLTENEKSQLSIDDIVLQLKMLSESMKKIYYLDGKCWNDIKEFSKYMGSYITAAFMKQCNLEELQTSEKREKRERATVSALYFLYVIKTLDLGMPDKKGVRTLSKALLVSVDTEKKECPDLQLVDRHFTGKREALLEAMTSFVKKIAGASKDPCWLSVMPWVHFLSGKCVPFEVPPVDVKHDEYKPVWWGVAEIERDLDYFKGKSEKWSIPIENMLKHLQPLFEADYFLPRSFIAAVDLGDLQKVIETKTIPVEACLAHLTYRLKTIKPLSYFDYHDNCNKLHSMTTDEKTVQQCVNSLLKQLQETFYSETLVESQWTMSYIIASHMLRKSIQNKRVDIVYLCAQVLIHCIAMYDRMILEQKPSKDAKATKHQDVLQDSAREAVIWVETYRRWDFQMKEILDVWNNIFAPVELQSEDVRNAWNKIISEGLVFNLEQRACKEAFQMQKFVELYCQKLDEYNPSMQECMSKVAFVAIAKGYTVDYGHFLPYQNKRFGSLLSELFISEWKKNVKPGKDEDITMLRHVLRWPPFSQYLKIYYKDQKKMEMLTEECLQHLIQAVSVIDSRTTALLTGSMTIGDFNQITEKDGKFPELAELLQIKKEHTAAFITKAIEIRQKELGTFQVQAKEMATLASVCTQLANVDRQCIDDTLKKQEHIEKHQIKEFCEPADVTKVDIETYQPRLCAFSVSPTVMNIVPHLHACCESSTFMMFWNAQCQEVYNQCATLDDVVQKVWSVVKNRWDTIKNRIQSGDIKFKDFEKVVGQRYRDGYDQMKVELRTMNIPERCIRERIDQLMKYRQLEACVKGAKTILKFAQEYKLKGDFTQIRVIATHGENDQDMKAFDNSVMKACEFLKDLTPDKEKCLKMFVTCEPLVHWLKESMKKSGLKELKVFVDLAFMSAGDEPINIARVQCLHSAVTGYAPLIFDLDERSGYKELLNLCAVVWKELDAN